MSSFAQLFTLQPRKSLRVTKLITLSSCDTLQTCRRLILLFTEVGQQVDHRATWAILTKRPVLPLRGTAVTAVAARVDIPGWVLARGCAFLPREGQTRELSVPGTILFLCSNVSGLLEGRESHVFLYFTLGMSGQGSRTPPPHHHLLGSSGLSSNCMHIAWQQH